MSELAIFLWGFGLGLLLARHLRDREGDTAEHKVGTKILAAARDVISKRRFTGDGVRITNISTLIMPEGKAFVSVSDYSVEAE